MRNIPMTTYWIPGRGAVEARALSRDSFALRSSSSLPLDVEHGDVVDLMDGYGNVALTVQVLVGEAGVIGQVTV